MPLVVDDIVRVRVFGRDGGGNFFQNVLHYQVTVGGTGDVYANLFDVLDAFDAAITGPLNDCMAQDAFIDAYQANKIDPSPTSAKVNKSITSSGSDVNAQQVGSVCAFLHLHCSDIDARKQGKFYVGGTMRDMFADDSVVAGVRLSALATALAADLVAGGGLTLRLCIRAGDGTVNQITGVSGSATPATMPRRIRPFG